MQWCLSVFATELWVVKAIAVYAAALRVVDDDVHDCLIEKTTFMNTIRSFTV